MHIVPPTPLLPLDIDDDSNSANNSNNNNNNSSATKTDYNFLGTTGDFILSNFLLLPDSFGDIYTGETFSAYIAVVNGYPETSFFMVTLAIRLQTSSKVFDLTDTKLISTDKLLQNERNGKDINNSVAKTSTNTTLATTTNNNSKTLGFNDTLDVLVQHTLTELGTHTLRVTVSYFLPQSNEPKSLRKFYRFNVLQPLSIASSFVMMQNKPMVQCQVINATKSPIYIKEVYCLSLLFSTVTLYPNTVDRVLRSALF